MRMTLTLCCLVLPFFVGSDALAQLPYGSALGEMRLSFDATDQVDQIDVQSGGEFEFFVMAEVSFGDPTRDAVDGINAWEAMVEFPAQVNILEREVFGNPLTCTGGSCGDDWFVILDGCVRASDGRSRLVRYRAQLLNDVEDQVIRLAPTSLSSFDGLSPGWAACVREGGPDQYLHPFASGWTSEIVVNSSVSTRSQSWAATKALYD